MKSKKLAYMGLFCGLAIILGYVETLLPLSIGVPGVKLGLANLAILYVLRQLTWREAACISLVRILVIGFLFGNLFGILYSLAGAALSIAVMAALNRTGTCSVYGISIAGGIAHNLGQLLMVLATLHAVGYLYYLPVLVIAGCITGFLIGLVVCQTEKRTGALLRK